MNEELYKLFQEDQQDRTSGSLPDDIRQRDRARRTRVEQLITDGSLHAPQDYFNAALIFQHGELLDHYWQAHELAKKAADAGVPGARWLVAAAYDRWLMQQGKPQKYGTQYISTETTSWRLWPVDPTTTDEERAEWEVPPLAILLQRVHER